VLGGCRRVQTCREHCCPWCVHACPCALG
jgi:hypothetical protein